jgi:signal transduction histidine kinase
MTETVRQSPWVRMGGVRVNALVLGADGRTPIYLEGRTLPPPPSRGARFDFQEAGRLLPPLVTVQVTLPLDSLLGGGIWMVYGAVLLSLLFLHARRVALREEEVLREAVAARDATVQRARSIQSELEKLQDRLARLEPAERAHNEAIAALERERSALQESLRELTQRESQLRQRVVQSADLDRERQALEDLLDDAIQDLDQKENEIRSLQERLQTAAKAPPAAGRSRGGEQMAKRMRTLYGNLEIEDRAIQDMLALGDESLRLRAEESLKRLDENPETAGVRRKVGGLPSHLSIFELGFAGKGRIYYSRAQRGFRILAVGGKASQKADLEYLSRLSLD